MSCHNCPHDISHTKEECLATIEAERNVRAWLRAKLEAIMQEPAAVPSKRTRSGGAEWGKAKAKGEK